MKKSTCVLIALVSGLLISASAVAHQGYMHGGDDDRYQGRGMMGGGMMGRGMMSHGMMGGGMMSHGMMGGCMLSKRMMRMLGLSDKQRSSIRSISRDLHKKIWSLMGKMIDARYSLHDLYARDRKDAKAIGRAYDRIFAIKRQIIVARIQAANKMRDVLTSKQRAQLKRMRRMMRRGDMGRMNGGSRKGRRSDGRHGDGRHMDDDSRNGGSGHMRGMMGN